MTCHCPSCLRDRRIRQAERELDTALDDITMNGGNWLRFFRLRECYENLYEVKA